MSRKQVHKRSALVDAAKKVICQQGFNVTTLVDISLEANIPLANVYYYFKTKEAIGIAVLNSIALEQQAFLEYLNQEPSSGVRLHYFLENAKQDSQLIMLQGCRIGTLCHEFAKEKGELLNVAAKIMMDALLWMEAQFHMLGFIEEASDLSLELTYRLQGIFLLGYALKDLGLITRGITALQHFIQEKISENANVVEESAA